MEPTDRQVADINAMWRSGAWTIKGISEALGLPTWRVRALVRHTKEATIARAKNQAEIDKRLISAAEEFCSRYGCSSAGVSPAKGE